MSRTRKFMKHSKASRMQSLMYGLTNAMSEQLRMPPIRSNAKDPILTHACAFLGMFCVEKSDFDEIMDMKVGDLIQEFLNALPDHRKQHEEQNS